MRTRQTNQAPNFFGWEPVSVTNLEDSLHRPAPNRFALKGGEVGIDGLDNVYEHAESLAYPRERARRLFTGARPLQNRHGVLLCTAVVSFSYMMSRHFWTLPTL